jgi:hypothetical protein
MRLSVLIICIVLFTGCSQRYWYRNKISLPYTQKFTVKVRVLNQSNNLLNAEFEEVMRKAAVKELKKKGYNEAPIDSPQFLFTLYLQVDSFDVSAGGPREINPDRESGRSEYRSANSTVRAVTMVCELKHYKQGWTKWVNSDDVYYFGEYRDIGRAEGMVRQLIHDAKDKQVMAPAPVKHF